MVRMWKMKSTGFLLEGNQFPLARLPGRGAGVAGATFVSKTAPRDLGCSKSQKSCKLIHYDQFLSSLCHNSTKTTDSTTESLLYLLQMGAVSRVDWSPSSEGAGAWEGKIKSVG